MLLIVKFDPVRLFGSNHLDFVLVALAFLVVFKINGVSIFGDNLFKLILLVRRLF